MSLHPVLLEKLNAALEPDLEPLGTPREARLPPVPGKVHAVIGMRRVGKTTFLRQLQGKRREDVDTERAVYLGFDDDRLGGIGVDQLSLLLEEYYRRFPGWRQSEITSWYLDEVQLVPGWERFVRRVMDSEAVEVVVSGSSARMLSREVHTSLRGRGIATVLQPFGFREFLSHRGERSESVPREWTATDRSRIEMRFGEFLREGGFPEAQRLPSPVRIDLLQGYVDTVLFRDVVERYGVSQVAALRWLVRHCLRNPAGAFSVHRLHKDLKSQGHAVGKDAVHALLGHVIDAFLVSTVSLATESERRRNSNPRKVYPADPGVIHAFDVSGRTNLGHALETVVRNELEARGAEVAYVKTVRGHEVDFLARYADGPPDLIQVCADPGRPETAERELRALGESGKEHPEARRWLLTLNQGPLPVQVPAGIVVQPTSEWILTPRA